MEITHVYIRKKLPVRKSIRAGDVGPRKLLDYHALREIFRFDQWVSTNRSLQHIETVVTSDHLYILLRKLACLWSW